MHFLCYGLLFLGWGSPLQVGSFLNSSKNIKKGNLHDWLWRRSKERMTETMMICSEYTDQGGVLMSTSTFRKCLEIFLTITYSALPRKIICNCPWPLCAADCNDTCTAHNSSERLLVGHIAKPLIFLWKQESCFPWQKLEHTWNWKFRRTKIFKNTEQEEILYLSQPLKKIKRPHGGIFFFFLKIL